MLVSLFIQQTNWPCVCQDYINWPTFHKHFKNQDSILFTAREESIFQFIDMVAEQ